jgi:hypothetical protein
MSSVLSRLMIVCLGMPLAPPLEQLGRFDARTIPEASGVVKSRRYLDIFWVHNDSGNPPLLFAIRSDGRIVREFRLQVPNVDWEDIAIDDEGHLYLGDIGNNRGALPVRAIYRIDEPDPSAPPKRPLALSAATHYAFAKGARFDAEALVYDKGCAVVVAKYHDRREAELFSVPLEPPAPLLRPAQPRLLGRLPGFVEPATGASMSADRALLAVCSEAVVRVYRRDHTGPWRLVAEVRYKPRPIEGVAWDGGDLILVAEGQGIYRLAESTWRALSPTAPAASAPPRGLQSNKPHNARSGAAAKGK